MLSPTPGTTEHTWVLGQVQKPRRGRTHSRPGQVHLLMRDRRGAWPRVAILRGAVLLSRARVAVTPRARGVLREAPWGAASELDRGPRSE